MCNSARNEDGEFRVRIESLHYPNRLRRTRRCDVTDVWRNVCAHRTLSGRADTVDRATETKCTFLPCIRSVQKFINACVCMSSSGCQCRRRYVCLCVYVYAVCFSLCSGGRKQPFSDISFQYFMEHARCSSTHTHTLAPARNRKTDACEQIPCDWVDRMKFPFSHLVCAC